MRQLGCRAFRWAVLVAIASLSVIPPASAWIEEEAPDFHGPFQHILQSEGRKSSSSSRPNIVFILTDDQDLHMNSLEYVPLIQKHLIDKGTLYKKHFCTTAICCPARVSILTGKLSHNTNVTDINPPYGTFLLLRPIISPLILLLTWIL
jgi:hypothetical protein